jgi:hypothetical protein
MGGTTYVTYKLGHFKSGLFGFTGDLFCTFYTFHPAGNQRGTKSRGFMAKVKAKAKYGRSYCVFEIFHHKQQRITFFPKQWYTYIPSYSHVRTMSLISANTCMVFYFCLRTVFYFMSTSFSTVTSTTNGVTREFVLN